MPTNDTDAAMLAQTPAMPDSHGFAALLLVESLIHGLIDRAIITNRMAIEIVESADSVQVDVAEAADGHSASMWRSHALLMAIANSLRQDDEGGPPTLHSV